MGKSKHARKIILDELGQSPRSKKELKRVVKAKDPSLKKSIKKALKKLAQNGEIVQDGDSYRVAVVSTESSKTSTSSDTVDALPIGMRMRQQNKPTKKSVQFSEPKVDLDDEIRRLEMELEESSSSDDSDADQDESDDQPRVLSLSEFAADRIEHLPGTYLPEPGKYKARDNTDSSTRSTRTKSKHGDRGKAGENQTKTDGLKEAVQEVLNGYKARSSEKIPFYCRFCAKQFDDDEAFFGHKQTEFHHTAVHMERKATYCRLCIKQLTSPAQMKEHLTSQPHKDRMHAVRSRQRLGVKRENNGRNKGQSKRQWT